MKHSLVSHSRAALVALVLSAALTAPFASACDPKTEPSGPVPFTGSFIGVPKITMLEGGSQSIEFNGVGTVSGSGDMLCLSVEEIYSPGAKPFECWGKHRIVGEHGDSFIVAFEAPTVETSMGPDPQAGPILHLQFRGTWHLEDGTGRYRGAAAGGIIYVDADLDLTTYNAIGRWSMWGDITYAPKHPGPRGHR